MNCYEFVSIPLPGFSHYQINRNGQIWSCLSEKFLKTQVHKGDERIRFRLDNKAYTYAVHRLVALTFIPNPHNYPNVHHKDGNTLNNSVDNLTWEKQKIMVNPRKSARGRSVAQILGDDFIIVYDSVTEASSYTGISRAGISQACLHATKTAGGYQWKYYSENNDVNYLHEDVDLESAKHITFAPNYYIFPDSRIYSVTRKRFLCPVENKSGYCYVTLSYNESKYSHYVHRLVAEFFLDKSPGLTEVNHKNRIKNDNSVENLEWVTRSENMKHAHKTKPSGTK